MLATLKQVMQSAVPLSGDAILILAGLVLYVASSLVLRHPFYRPWALLPGLAISIAIEGVDIVDHYGVSAIVTADAKQLLAIVERHARDVLVFNLAPVLIMIAARFVPR